MIAQIETAVSKGVELVDKASVASDRWLFLAALMVIIGGGALIIRWLVSSLETKDAKHDAAMAALQLAHTAERAEWRVQQAEAKAGFLEALKAQRTDFREELSLERSATARMSETVAKLANQISEDAKITPHIAA